MAEQIPFGVAIDLINKLASFAFTEIGRIYGVSAKLDDLKRTLESIHIVLSDAEMRQGEDPLIKHWISMFKQVLHDADDLLDALEIKDLRRELDGGRKGVSKVRCFFSSDNPLVFRAKLARKIEEIQKSFDSVAEMISKLNLQPSLIVLRQNESDWRETSSFVLQSDIVGREEDKGRIIDLLKQTHTDQNVSLVAIVGMGGLGKTALTQLVYNDAGVQNLFHKKMWVCVSEDFEVKLLLKKMLKSLNKNEVDDLELDQIQKMLQEELNGKRYVLVLDDVWNESQLKWDALRTYLMCGGEGSKIVVTTRSEMVSEAMGVKNPYVLKGLTQEQSWTLLKNFTFRGDTSGMSQSLESIGEKIAQKCGGVPLAIKTMGGLLRNANQDSDQWLNILNDNIWRLCEESGGIMPVLKLSYQNLPLELRQCFAYCSLFPKDETIETDELIQLWMAQGYLASSIGSTQSMEDVGNQYVKILLMRSFFQDASEDEFHKTNFKMHDLMHDLAMSVAGNDCLLVAKGKGISGRPMHVAFEPQTICSLDMFDESKVRTVIWCQVTSRLLSPSFKEKFKYLRALDLSLSSITQLPESIDKIKHLRYLDLTCCEDLISLPKSIGNLVCLQTLKLKCCSKLVFPIEVIPKLINLRHLDIVFCKAFDKMMPAGLGKLTSLQYLSRFVVGDNAESKRGKLNELKELNNIRGDLQISNLSLVEDIALEAQEADLKAKKHIRVLWLRWGPGKTNKNSDSLQLLDILYPHQNLRELTVRDYPGEKFSSWLSTLTSIVQITLKDLPHCQYLSPLERLPCLKKLLIENMGKLQSIHYEEISDVFFLSLEELSFIDCENLRGWERLGDANKPNDMNHHVSLPPFPHLSSLKISECPKLTCIPAFPHLVKKLELDSCSMKLLDETCLDQLEPPLVPLSTLMHLKIGDVTEVEAIAEDWMQNLTSLKRLTFVGSFDMQHMSRQLQYLPFQLEQLKISNCESHKLCLWENEDHNSTQLQAPFHCLRSLQEIRFVRCRNLKALPEEIKDLQSLRLLEIRFCRKLESLPEAMCRLTNLQSLTIYGSPLLRDRCKEESGEDWPKIAHIPNRSIR